jgi:hypothetical protein
VLALDDPWHLFASVKVNINAREELERRMDPKAARLEEEVAAERRARLDLERQLAELTARQHQRQAMVHRTSGGGGGEYRAPVPASGDYAAFGAASSRSHAASYHATSYRAAARGAPTGGREASRNELARRLSTRRGQSRSPSRSRSRSSGRSSGSGSDHRRRRRSYENHDRSGDFS